MYVNFYSHEIMSCWFMYLADGIDFMRDIFAYIVVLAVIVAVAYDGTVCYNYTYIHVLNYCFLINFYRFI